jgi:hypothetical protein
MVEQLKNYCPACGHILAKTKRGISTIEYRRTIHGCSDIDSLRENIYKLIKIFRYITRDAELTVAFSRDCEEQLNNTGLDIDSIKIWLLKQINGLDNDVGEKALYRLLFDIYAEEGINEPFAVFYDIYAERTDNPLSKNCVSRALRALGLATKMIRMVVDGKEKNVISICATREELISIANKNGIDY